MKQSQLVSKTTKHSSQEELSLNARLLTQAGFIDKLASGVYSFLPLGLKVLSKIENIIREELNRIGAHEVLMPALLPRSILDQTGRWDTIDVLFKLRGAGESEFALGATHEEVVAPLVTNFVQSYRDLPKAVYQIQTKFRNEPRAKSGLLRGREFRMNDMYSFHVSQEDQDTFYDRTIEAYNRIFARCGLGKYTVLTSASGGVFSRYSHEFQAIHSNGEDTIYRTKGAATAINQELALNAEELQKYTGARVTLESLECERAIEIGNIFKLGTRFPDAFNSTFANELGINQSIYMGCYGIGSSRLMGAAVEVLHDDKGILWPAKIAPFSVHLLAIGEDDAVRQAAEKLYAQLTSAGVETLFDDRGDFRAGEKFSDSDLLGMPLRVVMSLRTLALNSVECKLRNETAIQLVNMADALDFIKQMKV